VQRGDVADVISVKTLFQYKHDEVQCGVYCKREYIIYASQMDGGGGCILLTPYHIVLFIMEICSSKAFVTRYCLNFTIVSAPGGHSRTLWERVTDANYRNSESFFLATFDIF
jgi:hypothetical protein